MSLFPTQYSTLSASALAAYVSAAYGLPNLRGRYLLRGVSDTYLLENEQARYILKVYRAAHRTRVHDCCIATTWSPCHTVRSQRSWC